MGIHILRKVSDLGPGLVLAPERFDPRRRPSLTASHLLCDYVDIRTENIGTRELSAQPTVLVLDTTHAYEGFVVFRHQEIAPRLVGSAKRLVRIGDVIISRLRPYLRQVAYVDEALFAGPFGQRTVVASTEFFVLRSKGKVPSAAFVPFLLSRPVQEALAAGQEGGHHPRFSKEQLEALPVPPSVVETAAEVAREMGELAAAVRNALERSKLLVEKCESLILKEEAQRRLPG